MDKVASYIQQIQDVYPELTVTDAQLNATGGQFSDVLIVNETIIFRFPKTPHVAVEMQRELPILDALQGKLPLPIPDVSYISEDANTGQHIFMGYPMIAGQPLLRDVFATIIDEQILQQIAQDLATFLKALHGLPVDTLGVASEPIDSRAYWEQTYRDFQDKLFSYMRPDARLQVRDTFEEALNNQELWQVEPVICHGDFGTGNILYADGHITGIIDFAFCAVDDPAQDVGALLASYGEAFLERVFIVYPELEKMLPRARFFKSNYAFIQALFALRDNNQADFDDGMQDYI